MTYIVNNHATIDSLETNVSSGDEEVGSRLLVPLNEFIQKHRPETLYDQMLKQAHDSEIKTDESSETHSKWDDTLQLAPLYNPEEQQSRHVRILPSSRAGLQSETELHSGVKVTRSDVDPKAVQAARTFRSLRSRQSDDQEIESKINDP